MTHAATNPARTVRIIILGSTGSIGTQTIDTIEHLNALGDGALPHFRVVGLAAGANVDLALTQARRLGVSDIALRHVSTKGGTVERRVRTGEDAAERLVRDVDCDLVVGAMVGIAGLRPIHAAIELGRDVALANKETLVAAGEVVLACARASGSRLLPVDSEHAGAWQLLQSLDHAYVPPRAAPAGVERLTLTASGGPFRTLSALELKGVTRERALAHPTWSMGEKNTIDSATLVNKALEIIEARWLFDIPPERLDAIIQPTSIVHALLETRDGSILAQVSRPDMRSPIQQALAHPARVRSPARRLDLREIGTLQFEAIDESRFSALALAREAMRRGGSAGAIFNAVNEVAVRAFLDGRIGFLRICELIASGLETISWAPIGSIDDVLCADEEARAWARSRIA